MEQQLSIPYLIHGRSYGAFVLGRPDDDYYDRDLELAGQLQRVLRGLYLRASPIARSPARARMYAAAERSGLTATELAVLTMLADGYTARGIGLRTAMSPRTASKHLEHIYRKLGVSDRLAAVIVAQQAGILQTHQDETATAPTLRGRGDLPGGDSSWVALG